MVPSIITKAARAWASHSTLLKSSAWIYGAQISRGVLMLVVVTIASRVLTTDDFGIFSFIQNFFVWTALVAELGFAIATARILTQSDIADRRIYLDAFIGTFITLSCIGAGLIYIASDFVGSLFALRVGPGLALCALSGTGVLWLTALREVLPAMEKSRTIAVLEAAPWVLVLIGIVTVGSSVATGEFFALIYTSSYFLVAIAILWQLGFSGRVSAGALRTLFCEVRAFGQSVYWARLVGTGGFILDVPLLAYFTGDATAVAFYAMAKALTTPLAMIGQSMSTAMFYRFSRSARVPMQVILIVFAATTLGGLGYLVLGELLIRLVLPEQYGVIFPYMMIWVLTAWLQSLYQLPTMFLRARGYGKSIRNLAMIFGAAGAILYFALIPQWQVLGACFAALFAAAIWTGGSWFIYLQKRTERSET